MSIICPAILAENLQDFEQQSKNVVAAKRLHIDLTNSTITANTSISLEQVSWAKSQFADLHVMYKNPSDYLATIVKLNPNLVVVHASKVENLHAFIEKLKQADIKAGLAVEPEISIDSIKQYIPNIDHVLIFSGDLGHFGGTANLKLLDKANQIKKINSNIEIGWDGGVNDQNVAQIVEAGVDVINVGGFIQKSTNPAEAFTKLASILVKA